MNQIEFTDRHGSFRLIGPEKISYLYFPVAGEGAAGIRSALTPLLGGDAKRDQNTFLYEPVSAENLHQNKGTRNFWCKFLEGAWSATGGSAETESLKGSSLEEQCELQAGFMWHRLTRESKKYSLSSEITTFVPVEFPETEVTLITINNLGNRECSFVPMTAFPLYARSADNIRDHRHVTSLLHRAVTTDCGVEITPTLTFDERGHKKNRMTYYVYGVEGCGAVPLGYIPATEDFIGEGGSFLRPEAVYGSVEPVPAGTCMDGYEITAALVFKECHLAAGESASFVVAAGIDDAGEKRAGLLKAVKSRSFADWQGSLERTKHYWKEQVNIGFTSGDKDFDSYMKWVAFQPVLRRIYGCSFLPHHDYGKGGRGWRDLWQDCLALLLMNPDGVRQMLLSNFDGVRMDGSNATIIGSRPGEFVADRNNITRVWMDHGFWPLHTIQFYIHQTGDLDILLEQAAYFKDRQVARGTKKDELWEESYGTRQKDATDAEVTGTVLEHILLQNLTACLDVGEHNRLLLRGADWNDALDMAAERGESVAFSYAYAGNLGTLAALLEKLLEKGVEEVKLAKELIPLLNFEEGFGSVQVKRAQLAMYCDSVLHTVSGEKLPVSVEKLITGLKYLEQRMKESLREEEWLSGAPGFFNGYYDNHGRKVESSTETEVRMMLTGQVFAVMSGTATKEQIEELVQAADRYLFDEKRGGYALNTDFQEVKEDLGRMFGFAYGHKENGAVFSHMAVMFGNALYGRGFAQEGYKALHALYRQASDMKVSKIYPGVPEYFNDRGRGMYHYLTGAASWYLMTVLTEMYGIKGRYGDLYFEPKLLSSQFDKEGQAKAYLSFSGRKLSVTYQRVEAPGRTAGSVISVTAAGENRENDWIPRKEILSWDAEQVHEIVVLLAK